MTPLHLAVRRAYDDAYDAARQNKPCSCEMASAAGRAAARRLYLERTGIDDALTDACVAAMIWPTHPYGRDDPQLHCRTRPEYGEQGDDIGDGLTAWAIRFFAASE